MESENATLQTQSCIRGRMVLGTEARSTHTDLGADVLVDNGAQLVAAEAKEEVDLVAGDQHLNVDRDLVALRQRQRVLLRHLERQLLQTDTLVRCRDILLTSAVQMFLALPCDGLNRENSLIHRQAIMRALSTPTQTTVNGLPL